MNRLEQRIHELVRNSAVKSSGQTTNRAAPPDVEWKKIRSLGTRLWLDTGDMEVAAKLWNTEFEALTTNNTLLNVEVQKGLYDELIGKTSAIIKKEAPGLDKKHLLLEIAFVLNAHHALRLVDRFDAHVSVELHTDLADDVERAVSYGQRYFAICPERFYVKIPLTPAGFLAARKLGQAGVPVNFTLGFSARQNVVAALLARPAFVNVFMGRLNAFVSDNKLGDGNNMGEKTTLATQRAMSRLRAAGRTTARLIGASMRNGAQVSALAGLDVFTMPVKVAEQYRAQPEPAPRSHVDDDPPVTAAPGRKLEDFNAASLWEVPDKFMQAADKLMANDPNHLTPDALQSHFERAGFPDFLPRWTAAEKEIIGKDGKIPGYEHWKDQLAQGRLGLDALLNISGLLSFAADQKALDDRVRSLIG